MDSPYKTIVALSGGSLSLKTFGQHVKCYVFAAKPLNMLCRPRQCASYGKSHSNY